MLLNSHGLWGCINESMIGPIDKQLSTEYFPNNQQLVLALVSRTDMLRMPQVDRLSR